MHQVSFFAGLGTTVHVDPNQDRMVIEDRWVCICSFWCQLVCDCLASFIPRPPGTGNEARHYMTCHVQPSFDNGKGLLIQRDILSHTVQTAADQF